MLFQLAMNQGNEVIILYNGYSDLVTNQASNVSVMKANCTCTLIRNAKYSVIVDTMTPWDGDKIKESLQKYNLVPDMIDYVISTHGHADHVGNNNLFLNAKHIVGNSISKVDEFYLHPFDQGISYYIGTEKDENRIEITPTPGHTLDSISVLLNTDRYKKVAIVGDLFEKEEDLIDPSIWLDAGSEDKIKQEQHRLRMLHACDYIVPGHGPMFKVTDQARINYKKLCDEMK